MTDVLEDAVHPLDAASLLRLLPTRPRLLALGEPTHGEDTLLDVRNDLFRQLVEEEGFRTIAVESDCLRGLVVDRFVTAGVGALDGVMAHGFSHEWGAFAGNRELVRWMRAHNEGRPAAEQVRFAGMDGPLEITHAASPREALTALHDALRAWVDADLLPCPASTLDRLLGDDDRWTNQAAMMDASQSIGRTREANELRLLADDLVALLEAQLPHLVDVASPDELDRARLHGRTATGLLRYHSWMADTTAGRMAWLLAVRDSMMAGNLLALVERGPVLLFAHNSHLQRERSSMRLGDLRPEWWSAGAIVQAHLGDAYAFVPTALGTILHHGVEAPPPETVEGCLHALGEQRVLVDAPALTTLLAADPPTPRESPWFGYAPLDPAHLPGLPALVYVRDCLPA